MDYGCLWSLQKITHNDRLLALWFNLDIRRSKKVFKVFRQSCNQYTLDKSWPTYISYPFHLQNFADFFFTKIALFHKEMLLLANILKNHPLWLIKENITSRSRSFSSQKTSQSFVPWHVPLFYSSHLDHEQSLKGHKIHSRSTEC